MTEAKGRDSTVNPADYAVRLTTTLNRLKAANACAGQYSPLFARRYRGSEMTDRQIKLRATRETAYDFAIFLFGCAVAWAWMAVN